MIFDLHCDTLYKIQKAGERGQILTLADAPSLSVNVERLRAGGYVAQCFALFTDIEEGDPYESAKALVQLYQKELAACPSLSPAHSYAELCRNRQKGKLSAILSMEDASPLGEDLSHLEEFYGAGVRMIGLLWNHKNCFGYPNSGGEREDPPFLERGLTEWGREAVRRMNRRGIIVDVSHMSDRGFFEVLSVSDKPIVASHSNARALCPHSRNLTDEMLLALAEGGGVVGINFYPAFLGGGEGAQDTLAAALSHILYIKKRIGIDHIALGSDFDGMTAAPRLSGADRLPHLEEALAAAGLRDGEIEKITEGNAARIFRTCLQA